MRVPLADAASICGVKPGTIRRWGVDKRITVELRWNYASKRWNAWYDVDELLHWVAARNPDALYSVAGLKPEDRPADTRHVRAS